jgi:hypothetical protein
MVQVRRVEPSAVRNTKDIDIVIHREHLERIKLVAVRHNFTFRHSEGIDVHPIFSDEKVKPVQVIPVRLTESMLTIWIPSDSSVR